MSNGMNDKRRPTRESLRHRQPNCQTKSSCNTATLNSKQQETVLQTTPPHPTVCRNSVSDDDLVMALSLDCEKLINLVYARPALWKVSDTNYHNRELKQTLWREIGAELQWPHDNVKVKWTSLRDSFRREYKKKQKEHTLDVSGKQEWIHFRQMLFLREFMSTRETGILAPGQDEDNDDITCKTEPLEYLDQIYAENTLTQDPYHEKPETYPAQTEDIKWEPSPNKKQKLSSYEPNSELNPPSKFSMNKSMLKNTKHMDDEYHFVMSLLPFLRKIPEENKLITRIRMWQLIYENSTGTSNSTEQTEELNEISVDCE